VSIFETVSTNGLTSQLFLFLISYETSQMASPSATDHRSI